MCVLLCWWTANSVRLDGIGHQQQIEQNELLFFLSVLLLLLLSICVCVRACERKLIDRLLLCIFKMLFVFCLDCFFELKAKVDSYRQTNEYVKHTSARYTITSSSSCKWRYTIEQSGSHLFQFQYVVRLPRCNLVSWVANFISSFFVALSLSINSKCFAQNVYTIFIFRYAILNSFIFLDFVYGFFLRFLSSFVRSFVRRCCWYTIVIVVLQLYIRCAMLTLRNSIFQWAVINSVIYIQNFFLFFFFFSSVGFSFFFVEKIYYSLVFMPNTDLNGSCCADFFVRIVDFRLSWEYISLNSRNHAIDFSILCSITPIHPLTI